jgi:hypothetical protein
MWPYYPTFIIVRVLNKLKMLIMNKLVILLIITIMISSGCVKKSSQPEWQKKYNDPVMVRKMFASPPLFYAPHAFWFWDDTLKPELISNMAEEMCHQGMNPGYAHGRGEEKELYPLLPKDEWLSDKWFDAFSRSLKNAENNGMTLGYCDEYWWPSGQAAGRVLQQHPELEAKYLDWKRYEVAGSSKVQYDSVDFAVAAKLDKKLIDQLSLTIIGEGNQIKWTAPVGNWVVYTYTIKHHPGFDGGKVNYLDPNLMKVFIPLVHEKYALHYGDKLGYSIPGSFIDNEGDFGWQMAWSDYLAAQYKEIKKRDIRLWLPLLTEKDKDGIYAKARCDWYDVVSDVYISCYFRPAVNWLNQHNMYYISNLWEESIQLQTQAMGDFMRVTRLATMPGTDCLEIKSQDVHDFKEVQSVAEFEDRPFMSEIMGVAGWGQTPAMMKKTINSVTSFGVTHVVPHGINVNRKIETIPYPADWFTENPYWNYFHLWTDFSRRTAFVNRQGNLLADVLLINPLESAFALSENYFADEHTKSWDPIVDEINDVYSNAMRNLTRNNIDYLIADKFYIEKGVIVSQGEDCKLSINNHDFSAIIIPPLYIISRQAAAKILQFAEKGGKVVVLGRIPKGSPDEGLNDDLIAEQMKKLLSLPSVVNAGDSKDCLQFMLDYLGKNISPNLVVKNKDLPLYTASRKIGNNHFYWIANNNDEKVVAEIILKDGKGLAEKWNCETGVIEPVFYQVTEKGAFATLEIEAYEGFWLVFNPDGQAIADRKLIPEVKEITIDGKWLVDLVETDTLLASSAKGLFTQDKEIDENKIKPGYKMDSTWKYLPFVYKKEHYPSTTQLATFKESQVTMIYKNRSKTENSIVYWRMPVPTGAVKMLFEDRFSKANVWIDGVKTEIKGNELTFTSNTSEIVWTWLQDNDKYRLTKPLTFICSSKEERYPRSWYDYGFLQHTGYVDYEKKVVINDISGVVKLDLGKVKYMAEVWINGKQAGKSLWGPFVFDISKYTKKGENVLKIRIGNLMVNRLWIIDDLGLLRKWGWHGAPNYEIFDAGLYGPIKLLIAK